VGNVTTSTLSGFKFGVTNYAAVTVLTTAGLPSLMSDEVSFFHALPRPRGFRIVTDVEESSSPDGPWTNVLSVIFPFQPKTNLFYRSKLSVGEPPVPP
jgi:hypothetical protein